MSNRPSVSKGFQAAELVNWEADESLPALQELLKALAAVLVAAPASQESTPPVVPPVPEKVPEPETVLGRLRAWLSPLWPSVIVMAAAVVAIVVAYLASRPSPEYARIPGGTFQMGATPDDPDAEDDEKPRHRVEITRGFWMSRTEVTVAAYKRFVAATSHQMPQGPGFNPNWKEEDHPIVNINWNEAGAYCEWDGGRLPTEAEWEYAARGGRDGLKYPWGNEIRSANAKYDNDDGTAAVGSYQPNGFELYDMAGNVWEWTADWHGAYSNAEQRDPTGPPEGRGKVYRGGSWYVDPDDLRCSDRFWDVPGLRLSVMGFRCVREVIP